MLKPAVTMPNTRPVMPGGAAARTSMSREGMIMPARKPAAAMAGSSNITPRSTRLWQSAYSEFYFSDVLWPAFRKIDFLRAVLAFQQGRRRYGR
jgi:hypothetical protein